MTPRFCSGCTGRRSSVPSPPVLLLSGGLASLQTAAIASALPFSVALLGAIWGFAKRAVRRCLAAGRLGRFADIEQRR
jgi:choline-glycine betaine transporter